MISASFEEGSWLDRFNIYLTTGLDISEQVSTQEIAQINEEMANKGDSKPQEKSKSHFIAFVEMNGMVYELDG